MIGSRKSLTVDSLPPPRSPQTRIRSVLWKTPQDLQRHFLPLESVLREREERRESLSAIHIYYTQERRETRRRRSAAGGRSMPLFLPSRSSIGSPVVVCSVRIPLVVLVAVVILLFGRWNNVLCWTTEPSFTITSTRIAVTAFSLPRRCRPHHHHHHHPVTSWFSSKQHQVSSSSSPLGLSLCHRNHWVWTTTTTPSTPNQTRRRPRRSMGPLWSSPTETTVKTAQHHKNKQQQQQKTKKRSEAHDREWKQRVETFCQGVLDPGYVQYPIQPTTMEAARDYNPTRPLPHSCVSAAAAPATLDHEQQQQQQDENQEDDSRLDDMPQTLLPGTHKHLGGAYDPTDGCIYGVPANAANILVLYPRLKQAQP